MKILWLSLLVLTGVLWLLFPEWFEAERVAAWIHGPNARTLYILLVLLRFFLLIPSTVPLLIGILLFPSEPFFLLSINLMGIVLGAYMIYRFGGYFADRKLLSPKKAAAVEKAKEKIRRHGFPIVLLWSFFPFVPTDLMCYLAGIVRMPVLKFLLALFLGELILVSIYVYTGKALLAHLF